MTANRRPAASVLRTPRSLTAVAAGLLLAGLATPITALDWQRITLNGYTSFEFELQIEDQGAGDPNGSFDADLIDLVFNFQVSDRVRAAADVTWEHGAASEDDRGNVALEYGFVEYTHSDLLRLRFGKMLTPFGYFNEIHTAKPAFLTVKEAPSTNKPSSIVDAAERFYPRFAVGMALQGDGLLGERGFNYDLLIANGEQDNTNPFEEDDNSSKSVTGRFRIELTDAFLVGVSAYHDRFTDDGTGFGLDTLTSFGLLAEGSWGRWRLLGEVALAEQRFRGGGEARQLGFFVQPSFHFDNGFTPYLRYDWVDPDSDVAADDGLALVLGFNYEISTWFMFKLENDYFRGGRASSLAQFPGRDYNELKAAVVLGF